MGDEAQHNTEFFESQHTVKWCRLRLKTFLPGTYENGEVMKIPLSSLEEALNLQLHLAILRALAVPRQSLQGLSHRTGAGQF